MISNFALGLIDDGVALWQRGRGGDWLRVGAVPLDHADLEGAVSGMVKVARALSPEGVKTKLVVPDDQILYCELEIAGGSREAQGAQIRASLSGRTPYPVEELDFDWTGPARRVQVAVVARETLVEAEEFALRVGLDPVCFVAAPAQSAFDKEPLFGLTRTARRNGLRADQISADPVLIETGIAVLPDPSAPKPKQEAPLQPDSIVQPAEQPEPGKAPEPIASETKADTDRTASAEPEKIAEAVAVKAAPAAVTAPLPIAAPSEDVGFRSRRKDQREGRKAERNEKAQTKPVEPQASSKPGSTAAPSTPVAGAKSGAKAALALTQAGPKLAPAAANLKRKLGRGLQDARSTSRNVVTQALGSLRKLSIPTPDQAASTSTPKTEALAPTITPNPKTNLTAPAASTRKDPLQTLKSLGTTQVDTGNDEAARMTIFGARGNTSDTGNDLPRRALLLTGAILLVLVAAGVWAFYFTASRPISDQVAAIAPVEPEVADPVLAAEDPEIEAALAATEQALTGLDDDTNLAELRGPGTVEDGLDAAPIQGLGEPDEGRIAGLRSGQLVPPQDAPLTLAPEPPAPFDPDNLPPLRSEISPQEIEPDLAEAAETEQAPAQADPQPTVTVTEGRPAVVPQSRPARLLRDPPEDLATSPVDETAILPDQITEETAEVATAEDIADDTAQAPPVDPITDALQRIGGLSLGEVLEAAPAAPIDALALSQGSTDPVTSATPDPSIPVQTTEDELEIGVQTGRPPAVPPVRPGSITPTPTAEDAPDQGATLAPDTAQDPTTETAQAAVDAPPPGGIALSALVPAASTRPAARPTDLRAVAPEPEQADPFADASRLAVDASLRPSNRPNQFAAVVQRALRAAEPVRQTPAPAQTAAAAPQAAAPIQTASAAVAMPNIPSSANVAREATQGRALNLRQVNLIGVMGTQSSRRALVRLSNGRVVTVRVGESLDGGQVTAIGDSELRYQRRGRDVVLRIAS